MADKNFVNAENQVNILVLGVSGMLGHTMFRVLAADRQLRVFGSARTTKATRGFPADLAERVFSSVDVENQDSLVRLFESVRPRVVVNCIGLIKQLAESEEAVSALSINALLPHRLAKLCALSDARLVHISTDCVFSGRKGLYTEEDEPDAQDMYGRSKLLGEVDYKHSVTLRTSIIGHELGSSHGLIEWFLSQTTEVQGYTRAIFSGLPTCELAEVVRDHVVTRADLHGLYQIAAEPISKYELLNLVNEEYGKNLRITPDDRVRIDRSLDGNRFREATGYVAPPWPELIRKMRGFL